MITQLVGNKVRIAEQNVIHSPLPQGQQWTRELTLEVNDGRYTIKDTFADTEILGWMIQTADTEHSLPQPVLPGEAMAIKGARLPNNGQFRGKWLNEKDPLQKAYVAANGHFINGILSVFHHQRKCRTGADQSHQRAAPDVSARHR